MHVCTGKRDISSLGAESELGVRVDTAARSLALLLNLLNSILLPDKCVDLLNSVLDFVVRVGRFDAQLED